MTFRPDVAIVGGGIAGLATALATADRGARVLVLDDRRAGEASRASAGMLAAGFGFAETLRGRAMAARDLYPAFLRRLHDATGATVPLDSGGIIELATNAEELAVLHASATAGVRPLDAAALATLEPALAGHAGGLLHARDGAVDPSRLMDALDAAVVAHPLVMRRADAVTAVAAHDNHVRVFTAGDDVESAHAVLASGAWAGTADVWPRPVPVRPVRGELLMMNRKPLRHVLYGAGGYLIPRGAGTLVGATSEDAGFDATPTEAGRAALLGLATRAVADMRDAMVTSHWCALRPMSPDGLPIIGPCDQHARLWYACGLSRNGILLGPWAADALARLITGEEHDELGPFGIARFMNANQGD